MLKLAFPAIFLILILSSCSGYTSPSVPSDSPLPPDHDVLLSPDSSTSGHHLLGMWDLVFDFQTNTATAVPQRFAGEHFNVRKFMEEAPCTNCLLLQNFHNNGDETFNIDVKFAHPFPGLDNLTGFDVRGIAIFDGSYTFPISGEVVSDSALDDMELLNADGYTRLFNPIDYPSGSKAPIFTYTKGKKASGLPQPATINGFKAFYPDAERRMFGAGQTDTQTYHIAHKTGQIMHVGYVVDASWEPPTVKPVENPLTDFGPNANCYEAYKIEASIGSGLMPGCGFAPYQIDVYDHQGISTIEGLVLEAPDLSSALVTNSSPVDMGTFIRFTGNIPNTLKAGAGTYKVLVSVTDTQTDPILGDTSAYMITNATVEHVPIDYDHGWRKQGRTLDNNNDNIFETTFDGFLDEVWTHPFTSGIGSTFDGTPVIDDFAVYVLADVPYNQQVYALDLNTGEPIWHNSIKFQPDTAIYRSSGTAGNCILYIGGSSVFAFDTQDGEINWQFEGADTQYVMGSPVVVDDKLVIWGDNNMLSAFDSYTGDFLWDYTTGEFPGNPGTPAYDNGVIYAGDVSGHAFALNIADGSEIWKTSFPAGGPLSRNDIWAQPVIADGLVWFGSWNCHLYGLDPSNGDILHDIPLGDQIPWAGPAFDGTHLYQPVAYYAAYQGLFTPPYKMMAIKTDGTVDWTFTGTGNEGFFSTPAVANNIVFLPSDSGNIYILDPATGNFTGEGTYAVGHPVTSGISIQNGRMYFMDTSGVVHCVQ
jgi:outer membrane protein assembly factor BamB